jgi:hypothetical protein
VHRSDAVINSAFGRFPISVESFEKVSVQFRHPPKVLADLVSF